MVRAGTLVLDIGTSSLKAALVDVTGAAIAVAEEAYGPDPAPHRQDPESWWRAACAVVQALGPIAPEAVAFSGTMENLIPMAGTDEAAGPAILYSDPCGERYCRDREADLAGIGAATILGNAPEPLMTAFKILWLAETGPEILARARWLMLSPKDVLILRMTGRAVADPTTATTSGLMCLASRQWSTAILDLLGIDPGRLPELLSADTVVGPLLPEAADAIGLPAGLPVVNGCGDAGANALGSGGTSIGDVSVYLGTSGWVARVVSDAAIGDPRPCYRLAHPLAGQVIEIVPVLSAGACAAWAQQLFGFDTAAADAAASGADAKPPEIVFLPYLTGERAPEINLDARGGFLGLDARHGPADLYYAVLEGVAFAIAGNLTALCDGDWPGRVLLSGGGARSTIWPQIIADLLGRAVQLPADPQFAAAAGVAILAGATAAGGASVLKTASPRTDRFARRDRLRRAFADGTRLARNLDLRPGNS